MGSTDVDTPDPLPQSPGEKLQQDLNIEATRLNIALAREAAERDRLLFPRALEAFETQADIQERGLALSQALLPIQAREAGFEPTFDEEGRVTGFEELPPSELEAAQEQAQLLAAQRTIAGLRGELPIAEPFERQRREDRLALENLLRERIGPGFETSTPGIEALAEFDAQSEALREGLRTGELNLVNAISAGRQQLALGEAAQQQQQLISLQQTGAAQPQFAQAGALFGQGTSQAALQLAAAQAGSRSALGGAQLFQQNRQFQDQLNFQAALQSAANRAQTQAGIFGASGTALGLGGGIAAPLLLR